MITVYISMESVTVMLDIVEIHFTVTEQ